MMLFSASIPTLQKKPWNQTEPDALITGSMESPKNRRNWKQKLFHEFTEYWINVVYMTLFFSAVILYRRLVLAEHGVILEDYFAGLIKALVIAKVVMIGAFMRISRKYENKPLIIPTVYKAILFTLWVMAFDIIEVYIGGLIKTADPAVAFSHLKERIDLAWLGAALVIWVSFLPFFAMKELSRVMGPGKFRGMFFKTESIPVNEKLK
jgi:hypothetical protein